MCGIAGIVSFREGIDLSEPLRRMTGVMAHRGPDSEGFFLQPGENVGLGHRRLSIIDLSQLGCQPITDTFGRYVLIFNGEIYNYREIKTKVADYSFVGNSDSEVLLAAFSKWGIDCLDQLKGMFAFAIWDRAEKVLLLCRDRLGVKPLYYYQSKDCFLFASEIRSLLSSELIQRKADKESVYEFFSFQSVGVPSTIVENVKQVKPGHYLRISKDHIEERSYWNIYNLRRDLSRLTKAEVKTSLRSLLYSSVERRMVSDVSVGAFLSGGIDSSAVVAMMSRLSTRRINTFTASFREKEFDESRFAKLVAEKFNTNHVEVKLEQRTFLDELENALAAMDSVSGDGVNTYVVSKAIKKSGIGVALSGIGGDELFAGYPTFLHWRRLQRIKPYWGLLKPFRKVGAKMISADFSKAGRLAELMESDISGIHEVYPSFRRILSRAQMSRLIPGLSLVKPYFEAALAANLDSIRKYPIQSQLTIAELTGYTLNTLLKDTDQMSMAVSLEIREPFFDHDLIEFILNIPDEIKRSTIPKGLLVEALDGLLPPEIVHRRKEGFVFPWGIWLKQELRDFATSLIKRMSDRNFVDGNALINLWNAFLAGDKRIRWNDLWLFVVLEYWLEYNGINE